MARPGAADCGVETVDDVVDMQRRPVPIVAAAVVAGTWRAGLLGR